ncbi:MAG: hypothetical protein FJ028_02610 [Chloroflexi bacterium]|nr:hypothetical protein [Chloroflexota bacterium]
MSATVAVLLPLILVVLTGVLELGAARVVAERARIAADLAALTAANDQDETVLRSTGALRVPGDAGRVAREHLALDLAPLAGALAADPSSIAAAAEVTVADRAVRLRADLPVRTPLLGALLGRPVTVIELLSVGAPR